jgi:hypothetical protein
MTCSLPLSGANSIFFLHYPGTKLIDPHQLQDAGSEGRTWRIISCVLDKPYFLFFNKQYLFLDLRVMGDKQRPRDKLATYMCIWVKAS